MVEQNLQSAFSERSTPAMRGAVNRQVLIALLALVCAGMAYRLIWPPDNGGSADPAGPGAGAPRTGARGRAVSKADASLQLDPTLRLEMLENSRSVNYTGSRRNIFLASRGAGQASGGESGGAGAPPVDTSGAVHSPADAPPAPPPPVAPPVVIPLKFFGIAERAGGRATRALLTSNDVILIAQVGQTVAQHFKIVRIGLSQLELLDTRDQSTHSIPLEESGAGAPAAAGRPE